MYTFHQHIYSQPPKHTLPSYTIFFGISHSPKADLRPRPNRLLRGQLRESTGEQPIVQNEPPVATMGRSLPFAPQPHR